MFKIIKELLEVIVKVGDNIWVWIQSFKMAARENWELISVIIIFLFIVFIIYKTIKSNDQKPVE